MKAPAFWPNLIATVWPTGEDRIIGFGYDSRMAALSLLPPSIRENFEVHEWKHACAILATDFPDEWKDLIALLNEFKLCKSWITDPGGNKSKVAKFVDHFLGARGWREKQFDTSVHVDQAVMASPTHDVDCYKNRVALEVEWNNKDPFNDLDLNGFRLPYDFM